MQDGKLVDPKWGVAYPEDKNDQEYDLGHATLRPSYLLTTATLRLDLTKMGHEEQVGDYHDDGRDGEGDQKHRNHVGRQRIFTVQRPSARVLHGSFAGVNTSQCHTDHHRRRQYQSGHPDDHHDKASEADAPVLQRQHRVYDGHVALDAHHREDIYADVHGEDVDTENQPTADVAEEPSILVVVRQRVEQAAEYVEQVRAGHVDNVRVDRVDVDVDVCVSTGFEGQQDHQGVGTDADDEDAEKTRDQDGLEEHGE